MSKEYEKIRNKIAKQYNEKISSLSIQNKNLEKENELLKEKLAKMEVQLIEKNEWIERMQEYCNLSEEELKTLVESEKSKEEARKLIVGFSRIMSSYL